MLHLSGLVVIASEDVKEIAFEYNSILKFEVASDIGNGKTQRHYINLTVPKKQVEEVKSKLVMGAVAEITHGTWNELTSSTHEEGRIRYSKVELKVKWENFKILKLCVYYEGVENITKET